MTARPVGAIKRGPVFGVSALAIAVVIVCGALGTWQWSSGTHAQSAEPDPEPVPLADVLAPASPAEGGVGSAVDVAGEWADAEAALVPGRTIESQDAVLVVRPYTVAADATGTGQEATLAVVVGWENAAEVGGPVGEPEPAAEISGYLRGSEGLAGLGQLPDTEVDGAFWVPTLSPAQFAQHWDSPLYSAVLVAESPEEGLNALPAPEPQAELNFRSIVYALEWWLFAAFFAFIAARWIRDNGRVQPAPAQDVEAAADTALKEGPS
ncbi:SURF1 family cytochrome oxidase biogenesis protein [Demequina globuliformis]|uniref:SURF1 family cytochrome oxidase biogenesis protein n=1 Tax=Demequina globuliformis TaxID=676202 RepID=UPI0007825DBC|nr:SURF1 family cytochrome oxidase biogenesis protein [Demequina globuliformis]